MIQGEQVSSSLKGQRQVSKPHELLFGILCNYPNLVLNNLHGFRDAGRISVEKPGPELHSSTQDQQCKDDPRLACV